MKQQSAPRAIALNISVPLRIPPSRPILIRPWTTLAQSANASTDAGTLSSCRPPWLETIIPCSPWPTASNASSGVFTTECQHFQIPGHRRQRTPLEPNLQLGPLLDPRDKRLPRLRLVAHSQRIRPQGPVPRGAVLIDVRLPREVGQRLARSQLGLAAPVLVEAPADHWGVDCDEESLVAGGCGRQTTGRASCTMIKLAGCSPSARLMRRSQCSSPVVMLICIA